ncbi:hypothetical protein AA0118_g5003 [Alternaria tenuissima]|nr:hypothetical protein AA0118_g5003 [Alternaria tenuissima]
MRVHNLLAGLLGLVGLAIAAPTPQSSAVQLVPNVSQPTIESNLLPRAAPQCSTLDPEKWLIHVCGRHVITNLLGVNLLNHCTALSHAVAHEVIDTSQSDGIICFFYDGSNHCNSEHMIATVNRHTDIPAPFGKRAEFVMCRRKQMGDAAEIEARGEHDSSPDLDSFVQPDESRALVSPVSNCITPDSRNHFLNICTEDSYGNAFPNRWIDTCVQLSPNVAHHVTIIVQKAGLMCKFYDDSNGCSGNVRYITRTKDKPHRFEPPAEFGNDLKYALCRRGEWKRDTDELKLETHDEDVTLDTTTDQSTGADTNEITTSTKMKYLLARISSDITSIELKENSMYICTRLSDRVGRRVTHTTQHNSAACQFFASNCDGAPLLTLKHNMFGYLDQAISSDIGSQITHVKCGIYGFPNVSARDEDTSSDVAVHTATKADLPLIAKIISSTTSMDIDEGLANRCKKLNNHVAHDVKYTSLRHDIICVFYENGCGAGRKPLVAIRPKDAAYSDEPMASDLGKKMTHVKCGIWNMPDETEMPHGSVDMYARDEDASAAAAADIIYATDPDTADDSAVTDVVYATHMYADTRVSSIEESALGQCYRLPNETIKQVTWIEQPQGYVCDYYQRDCQDGNVLRTLDTRKAKWSYPTEPEVGMQIEYAMCKHSFDKRDGPVMSEGPVVNSPLSVVASSSVTLDSQITKLPALERGQLRIGEDIDNKQIRAVVNALNVCVNFPTPQYPNSTRTLDRSGLTICKYYAETECAEPLMLDALNDEEKDWKIRSDFAQRINSAKCTIFESVAPANIRVRVPESTLEWGQLRIGEDLGNTHIRKVVSALNGCVDFPTPMYPHSIHFLEQSGRSECLFYSKSACPGAPVLHTLNPEEKDLKQPTKLAQQINSAQCAVLESLEIPPTSIQTRSELLPQVKANGIQVTVGHSVSALSTSSLKVADLYICNEANLDPAHCTVLHTLNQCVAFPGPFAYQTKVITQAKGSLCKYYTKPGCMAGDLYFSYMSNPTQDARLSGWGVEKLAGVWCGGTGAISTADVSAVNTRTSIDSSTVVPSNLAKRGNPFYHWSTSPGSTSICRQRNFTFCTNNAVNALHQCVSFAPADQGPASMIQYTGVYCKWYADSGGASGEHKAYDFLDSRKGDAYADGLSRLYRSVKCGKDAW